MVDKKLLLTLGVLLILAVATSATSLPPPPPYPYVEPLSLVKGQRYPATSESFIVFQGINHNSYPESYPTIADPAIGAGSWDIFVYEFSGPEGPLGAPITRITNSVKHQVRPDIHYPNIVWMDKRNGNWDIYAHDLTTGQETQLTSVTSAQKYPAIWNDKIVYEDGRNKGDIWLYDLATGSETLVSTNSQNKAQRNPDIWGDWVVWEDKRNGNWDIYAYNLTTGEEKLVGSGIGKQRDPEVHDGKVVYEDRRNGNWDIYLYDLLTDTETRITANNRGQKNPAIYGNFIVWSDKRAGNWDIYTYNLDTGEEIAMTDFEHDHVMPYNPGEDEPAVGNELFAWHGRHSGDRDIYYLHQDAFTPPTITGLPDLTMPLADPDGIPNAFNLDDYSSDPDNDPLTYTLVYSSTCTGIVDGVSIDPANNMDIGPPLSTGSCIVVIGVSDGVATSTDSFHITVS